MDRYHRGTRNEESWKRNLSSGTLCHVVCAGVVVVRAHKLLHSFRGSLIEESSHGTTDAAAALDGP